MRFDLGQEIIDKIRGKNIFKYDTAEERLKLLDKNLYFLCDDFNRIEEFRTFMQNDNFLYKYKRLIKDLPEESLILLSRILNRVLIPEENQTFWVDDKEKKDLKNMEINRINTGFKLGEIFYCQNHFIKGNFCSSLFNYEQELNNLKTIDKIKNKDIIDVGAYIGDTAIILSKYTNQKVFAFEPMTQNYNSLEENIKLNELTNVLPQKIGLGSEKSTMSISIANGSSKIGADGQTEKIEVTTLDDFVKENSLSNIGLIKVDVEGFEQEFLKGAINTIKTQKPTLLLSIYHNPNDFFDIKPMLEDLNLGYEFQIIKTPDIFFLTETMLYAEVVK